MSRGESVLTFTLLPHLHTLDRHTAVLAPAPCRQPRRVCKPEVAHGGRTAIIPGFAAFSISVMRVKYQLWLCFDVL